MVNPFKVEGSERKKHGKSREVTRLQKAVSVTVKNPMKNSGDTRVRLGILCVDGCRLLIGCVVVIVIVVFVSEI